MLDSTLASRAEPPAPSRGEYADGLSAHAPARGTLARALGRFHVTGAFWYRFHLFAVRRFPAWAIPLLAPFFTLFFFVTLRRIRRALGANLEAVLGPSGFLERQQRIYRTLHTFGWCLTERYEHFAGRRDPHVTVEQGASWNDLKASPSGWIVLTAHVGNWEVSSSLLPIDGMRPVHVVREREISPDAQRLIRELVERRAGSRLVTHFAGDPALSLLLSESLARGEIVALQGDRPRGGGRTLPATMFGRATELPAGPLALARIARVPIVPVFSYRTGRWRYRITIGEPISVPCTANRRADLQRAASEVARAIESAIAAEPHQWFCFAEMWPRAGSAPSR